MENPDIINSGALHSADARKALAKMLMRLFDLWALDNRERALLLGLSPSSRATLAKYARGEAGIANTRDSLDRAGYLLAIHKALRLLYPENPELRYGWMQRGNRAFDGRAPLAVVAEEGLIGLARVSRYLDFVRGQ